MSKKKNKFSFYEKEFIFDYFSKVKDKKEKVNLDFVSVENDVKATLNNLAAQKKEDFVLERTDTEKEYIEKINELNNLCNYLHNYVKNEKNNEKEEQEFKNFLLEKEKENKKIKYFDPMNLKFNNSAIKRHKNPTSKTIVVPPVIYKKGNEFAKYSNVSCENLNKKQSNKIYSLDVSKVESIKSFKANKSHSNSKVNLSNVSHIEIEKNHKKIKMWEDHILNPLNRKYDIKSNAMINLNKIRSYSNLKKTKKLSTKFEVKSRIFSGSKDKENNSDVSEILTKINAISAIKKNHVSNQRLIDLINKQKNLLNENSGKKLKSSII